MDAAAGFDLSPLQTGRGWEKPPLILPMARRCCVMNRTTVAIFGTRSKAEPLQQRLVQAGIPAEIHDELHLQKLWFISKDRTGARLEVPSDQFERAYQLLLDWDAAEGLLRDAVRCPECKSLRVQYPQFTRKSLIPNLVVGTLAAIGQIEKQYYCDDCHYTWPKQGTKPSALRPNMSPYYFIDGVEQSHAGAERSETEASSRAA